MKDQSERPLPHSTVLFVPEEKERKFALRFHKSRKLISPKVWRWVFYLFLMELEYWMFSERILSPNMPYWKWAPLYHVPEDCVMTKRSGFRVAHAVKYEQLFSHTFTVLSLKGKHSTSAEAGLGPFDLPHIHHHTSRLTLLRKVLRRYHCMT